jgi:cytoskeletal protein RodZ
MMNDIGKKITEERQKRNLTIEQLSEITKVRHHVIKAIEAGDYSVMPEVYMKSFIKTITKYLQITELESGLSTNIKSENISNNTIDSQIILTKEVNTKIQSDILLNNPKNHKNIQKIKPKNEEIEKYAELFKKKNVKKVSKVGLVNYGIYLILAIAVILAIVITLFNFHNDESNSSKKIKSNNNDTLEVQQPKNTLLAYFEKSDSLIISAKANDTSWVRVVIDGTNFIEILMKPGQEDKWGASEYFLVDQGNVGAINFYRNGELLPLFGKPGTVVKNIKITRDKVLNSSFQKDTIPVLKPNISKKKILKKEPEKHDTRKLIQESEIQTSPSLLKKNKPN